jgi:error-prone DNA polymerase
VRRDGVEVLAHWRETGAWWAGEAPVEVVQWRDRRGVRREARRELPAKVAGPTLARPEDHTEEVALRPRKTRDEKVAIACGLVTEPSKVRPKGGRSAPYVPLHLLSGCSFGRSVLLPREAARRAAEAGLPAACLVDRFSLAGSLEFAHEAKANGIKPLLGASFETAEGGEVVLVARDKHGWQSLSSLVTECHLEEPRLFPLCTMERLERHARGLLCLTGGSVGRLDRLVMAGDVRAAGDWLDLLVGIYGRDGVYVEIERSWLPWGMSVESRLDALAREKGLTQVAGGPVAHARPEDFPAQDVMVCAETLCTVDEVVGRKPCRAPGQPSPSQPPLRAMNAERHLRTPDEARALFRDRPDLLDATLLVAERCDADVLPGRTRLPQLYGDPDSALRQVVWAGARLRHPQLTKRLRARLDFEVDRIARLGFSDHFLAAWDLCRWAREQDILFSGRGSVVDSAVAYCLGFSRIDADAHSLHFDRFLPEDGSKRPDIDIDFEARRRDEVREYLSRRYGKERVATVAAIGAFCSRGIVREVGKALGLSPDAVAFLAKRIHGAVSPDQIEAALDRRPELRRSEIDRERLHWLFRLAGTLADVPRNMRAHSSGVVVSDRPLCETVPVQWSGGEDADGAIRIIQWDKRSAKYVFDKFDLLCLRGQDVLRGAQTRVREHRTDFSVEQVPLDDPETFRAMRSGELIGIPQSASPAMRQAHMRLQTRDLHDASLVQAGIRPGVGGAVKINELIARRRGTKRYAFEHPELERILGLSYGIVVFQEQIDQLLQTFAGYSSGEAEDIRDAIHKRRREDYGQSIKEELLARVAERGYAPAVAEQVFEMVSGFKGYGFAQGHALAFAEISLRSIHCQQNYPAEYFASLLDAQPAGYYGPCTLANEARSRGVAVLPPDVSLSDEGFKVEDVQSPTDPRLVFPNGGIRVGLAQVSGLSAATRKRTVAERGDGYRSFADFVRRARPDRDECERLALCGALDRFSPNRRALLWAVAPTLEWARTEGGLWDDESAPPIDVSVPDFSPAERAVRERAVLDLDVERHLMAWERERAALGGAVTAAEAKRLPPGTGAVVVGNPIRLRFPPTPSGKRVVFFDLEDETGLLNVTCFDAAYQRDGHNLVCNPYLTVRGVAQWRDGHTAFLVRRMYPYDPVIRRLVEADDLACLATADFLSK